ncbi:hypothetical protein WMF38_29590 [Sorangium sp. So ce118]
MLKGIAIMRSYGISALSMAALCIASASTLTACEGVDESELPPEELVGEADDEIFSCSYQTITANSTKTTTHWDTLSVGDNYGDSVCRRYIVEFTNYDFLEVGWDDGIASEQECESTHIVYTAYTNSGGSWINNGTYRGHGNWLGLGACGVLPDSGYSPPTLGSGTKYRIAVGVYDDSCGPSGCYSDYKRVGVRSIPDPL